MAVTNTVDQSSELDSMSTSRNISTNSKKYEAILKLAERQGHETGSKGKFPTFTNYSLVEIETLESGVYILTEQAWTIQTAWYSKKDKRWYNFYVNGKEFGYKRIAVSTVETYVRHGEVTGFREVVEKQTFKGLSLGGKPSPKFSMKR